MEPAGHRTPGAVLAVPQASSVVDLFADMQQLTVFMLVCFASAVVSHAIDTNWSDRRAMLVTHLLGTDGKLPTKSQPDFLESVPGPQMKAPLQPL